MATTYRRAGATFSANRQYRYRLWRDWNSANGEHIGRLLWIMLNPSTADETMLDPTLRRCERFAQAMGYDGFEVVNLFAWRSTDPKQLRLVDDPVGEDNDAEILSASESSSSIIVGWGRHVLAPARAAQVITLLSHRSLFCLGENGDQSPKHPLYLAKTTQVRLWSVTQ